MLPKQYSERHCQGSLCRKCGTIWRYQSTGRCVVCSDRHARTHREKVGPRKRRREEYSDRQRKAWRDEWVRLREDPERYARYKERRAKRRLAKRRGKQACKDLLRRKRLLERLKTLLYMQIKKAGKESPIYKAMRARESEAKRRRYREQADREGRVVRKRSLTDDERREARRVHRLNRDIRKRGACGPGLSRTIRRMLWMKQNGRCALCCQTLDRVGPSKYHLDHIEPLAMGGAHTDTNIQLLCPPCNVRKGVRSMMDMCLSVLHGSPPS